MDWEHKYIMKKLVKLFIEINKVDFLGMKKLQQPKKNNKKKNQNNLNNV